MVDHEITPKSVMICAGCGKEIFRPLIWAAEWYHLCNKLFTDTGELCNLEEGHDGPCRRLEMR